ncbi:hypothetical protein ACNAN0_10575 [Agrilactobacillus fermenti]|uniref:hypothetical protein n=1 Tax=Agrilactobacillus fermenti TaxID=2586909 RepID=UPI003A5C09E6
MPTPQTYQIYLADVSFDGQHGAKYRHALVMVPHVGSTRIYKITNQYHNKSSAVRAVYYPIREWQAAGLKKPSYVVVHKTYIVPTNQLVQRKLLGVLTDMDAVRLAEFIVQYQSQIRHLSE